MAPKKNQPLESGRKKCIRKSKRRPGEKCGAWAMKGKDVCYHHGGGSTGPKDQTGNQNAKTHGLFSKSLNEYGQAVYSQAKDMDAQTIARDTAEFVVAKIAEAFYTDEDLEKATGLVGTALALAVARNEIDKKTAQKILARLSEPDIGSLGKALGPLKGLLEVKAAGDANDEDDDDQQTGIALVPEKSDAWRDLTKGAQGMETERG